MTGFAFAYAVVRVCGGQSRKNPGAPRGHLSISELCDKYQSNFDDLSRKRRRNLYTYKLVKDCMWEFILLLQFYISHLNNDAVTH